MSYIVLFFINIEFLKTMQNSFYHSVDIINNLTCFFYPWDCLGENMLNNFLKEAIGCQKLNANWSQAACVIVRSCICICICRYIFLWYNLHYYVSKCACKLVKSCSLSWVYGFQLYKGYVDLSGASFVLLNICLWIFKNLHFDLLEASGKSLKKNCWLTFWQQIGVIRLCVLIVQKMHVHL